MRFFKHARDRMRERGIRDAEVRQALNDQLATWPSKNRGRTVILGQTSTGRKLKIVVQDSEGKIVTVAPVDG